MTRRLPDPRAHVAATVDALRDLDGELEQVEHWGLTLAQVLLAGGRLLTCGNGGSAADAQHLTAELVGRYREERPPLSAIALTAETSSVTAIANDYGYEEVFARQVRAHGRPGDVLLAISTSGRSESVVAAARTAGLRRLRVWALTGPPPNPLWRVAHETVSVDAPATATIQEVHGVLIHAICAVTEAVVLGAPVEERGAPGRAVTRDSGHHEAGDETTVGRRAADGARASGPPGRTRVGSPGIGGRP